MSTQIPAAYPQVAAVASTTAASGANQCRFLSAAIAADTASYFTTDGAQVLTLRPRRRTRRCEPRVPDSIRRDSFDKAGWRHDTHERNEHGRTARRGSGGALLPAESVDHPSDVRGWIAIDADRPGVAPLNSPSSGYTFDGVREGVAQAP